MLERQTRGPEYAGRRRGMLDPGSHRVELSTNAVKVAATRERMRNGDALEEAVEKRVMEHQSVDSAPYLAMCTVTVAVEDLCCGDLTYVALGTKEVRNATRLEIAYFGQMDGYDKVHYRKQRTNATMCWAPIW